MDGSLRPDSGGAGRHRGGLGTSMCFEALAPMMVSTTIERVYCRPWGLRGGGDALGNNVAVMIDGAWTTELPNAKLIAHRLKKGDAFLMQSGGGFGRPEDRDPDARRVCGR